MVDIDFIILVLSLLIFFYTFELVCKFIEYVRRKKKEENNVEGFDLDDITDNKLFVAKTLLS